MCYDVINLLCLLVFMHLKNIEVWIHELLFCGATELSFFYCLRISKGSSVGEFDRAYLLLHNRLHLALFRCEYCIYLVEFAFSLVELEEAEST